MKRFDKRFIYASLIRDFFFSLIAVFFLLSDFFLGEETDSADIAAVIPFLLIGFGALFLCFQAIQYILSALFTSAKYDFFGFGQLFDGISHSFAKGTLGIVPAGIEPEIPPSRNVRAE